LFLFFVFTELMRKNGFLLHPIFDFLVFPSFLSGFCQKNLFGSFFQAVSFITSLFL